MTWDTGFGGFNMDGNQARSAADFWQQWRDETQANDADYQQWADGRQQQQQQQGQDWDERNQSAAQEQLVRERRDYRDQMTETRSGDSDTAGRGLDDHDFYNIDTAHELEAAMQRAAVQGVDYGKPDQFQRFLDREAEAGVGQVEGRRSLSDRHQEIRQQSHAAASLTERGARPDQIPAVKLYESAQEQQFRVEQERSVRGQERSPARERLAEIRTQHGIAESDRSADREPSRGRSR
jgi:hypothetical protein